MEGKYDSSEIGPSQASVFRSNEQIRADVEEMIKLNDAVHPKNIDVSVDNGIVTLKGSVDSNESSDEAVMAAREVIGVIDVKNQLEVSR